MKLGGASNSQVFKKQTTCFLKCSSIVGNWTFQWHPSRNTCVFNHWPSYLPIKNPIEGPIKGMVTLEHLKLIISTIFDILWVCEAHDDILCSIVSISHSGKRPGARDMTIFGSHSLPCHLQKMDLCPNVH